MLWLRIFLLALLLHSAPEAMAANFIAGISAYKNKDYNKAIEIWEDLAERGHVQAMTNLGNLYLKGLGVKLDTATAFYWYKMAAKRNYPQAEFALGLFFAAKKNYKDANYWYGRAAVQEFAAAQNNLGRHYKEGLGVEKNLKESLYWYNRAAAQGFLLAQVNLGLYYLQGKDQDKQKAEQWLILGAAGGSVIAQLKLAELYETRGNIKEATRWYWRAAKQESAAAQAKLGLIFLNGKGRVRRSYFKAISFLGVAAQKGEPSAQTTLGSIYLQGFVVERDIAEGLRLLKKAAAQNYAPAFFQLSKLYSVSKIVPADKAAAKEWLNKAIEAGHDKTSIYLGEFLEKQKDLPTAIKAYEAAANRGYQKALIKLGNIYLGGRKGIPRNVSKARTYLLLAANQGNRVAQYNLAVSWTFKSKTQTQNLVEAMKWLLLSASQNLKSAHIMLSKLRPNLTPQQIKQAERAVEKFKIIKEQPLKLTKIN